MSSIAALLAQLTGGDNGPQMTPSAPPSVPMNPQAAPLPTVTAPQQPGLLHRIMDNLSNIGAVPDAKGYEGLLSPDDIQSAKPGFMARLSSITPGAPTPGEQYHANLDNIVKMRGIAAATAEHSRVLAARRAMADLFPAQPNETTDQTRQRLSQMYAYALSHGDEETVKDVGSRLSSIFAAPKPEVNHVLTPGSALVGPDGKVLAQTPGVPKAPIPGSPEWKAAEEFKAKLAAQYRVEPTQIIQGQDDNGDSHFYVVPKHGGTPVPLDGIAPKVTLKTENAQQELTRARAEAAVSEMNNGAQYMHDFEQKLARGQVKIGNSGQIIASIANTFTHDDPASKVIQNSALSALNKSNPELARYIRRALSFAEAESMISSRPSDFRTRMSAFLSAAANGATPDMISDIESRRNAILNPLNRIYNGQPSAHSAPRSAPRAAPASSKTPSYEEWKRSKGIP